MAHNPFKPQKLTKFHLTNRGYMHVLLKSGPEEMVESKRVQDSEQIHFDTRCRSKALWYKVRVQVWKMAWKCIFFNPFWKNDMYRNIHLEGEFDYDTHFEMHKGKRNTYPDYPKSEDGNGVEKV